MAINEINKMREKERREKILAMVRKAEGSPRAIRNRKIIEGLRKKREQADMWSDKGSGYEAMSRAGEKRAEAEDIRMKKLADPNWKPSDNTFTEIYKQANKVDARNSALDPENDPEMLSGLRNALNISPTKAEVERRLRARNNAKLQREKLSEGESEGAIAGQKAEALRRLRAKELASSRTPQAYDDHRIKSKQRYDKLTSSDLEREADTEKALRDSYLTDRETGQFKDYKRVDEPEKEEGLMASALRKGGEGIDSIRDYLSGATAHKEGAEAAYADHMGMGVDRRLQEAADENRSEWEKMVESKPEDITTARRKKQMEDMSKRLNLSGISDRIEAEEEGRGMEKSLNQEGESPDYDPSYAASLDQGDIEQEMTAGAKQDKLEDEINQEFTGPIGTQEEAQKAIYDVSEEEQKEISKLVAEQKGMGSDEWVETKEATGNYVRYEGTGLVINMKALQKDIDRNRNMEMLKNIPAANRPAMLVEWGYIDKDDLSIAQKKSAKELKEESLLDLKIANAQLQKEKLSTGLSGEKKVAFDAAHKGMLDAAKNENWELAETYRRQINELSPSSDTTNYSELFEKQVQKNKRLTPNKLFTAAGLKSGEPYYKSRLEVSKAVSFLRTSKATSKSLWEDPEGLGKMVESGPEAGTTYAQLLKNHGIYSWDKIFKEAPNINDRVRLFPNIPKEDLKDEESYMNWALPSIKNSLLKGIWGSLHTDHERITGEQREANKEKLAEEVTTYEQPYNMSKTPPKKLRTKDGKEFISYGDEIEGQEKPDPGMINLNREAKEKADKKKKASAIAKKKADKAKSLQLAKDDDKRYKMKNRQQVELTTAEKNVEYMKEGKERLDALVKGIRIGGMKKGLSGHPKFNSQQEAIKYYKKNPKKLQKMSVAFRHFISQK